MKTLIQPLKLIKISTAFLFALMVIIVLLPTKVSAVEGNWDALKGGFVSGPSTVTIQDNSTGTLSVDSGTVIINGTATINSTLTVRISTGATVQWNANLTTGSNISGDFIVFEGNGSLVIEDAEIEGSATGDLVEIASTISSVEINTSEFTNTNSGSNANALYLYNGGTLNSVSAVSTNAKAIALYDGTLTIEGSNNVLTGYDYGLYAMDSVTISIENATIETTINDSRGYAVYCGSESGNLTLTNVDVGTVRNEGIVHNNASATVTLIDCDLSAYMRTVYALGVLIIEDCIITEENAVGYAVQATGDLTIRENGGTTLIKTISTLDGSYGNAVIFDPGSAKTFTLSGGTITSNAGNAVYIKDNATVNLTGGEITYTGSANYNSALYIYGNADVTVSGTDIDGGKSSGVIINNSSADLTISSGSISGITGLDVTKANEVSITGGTFDGTSGYGIDCDTGTVEIAPTASTEVIVKGTTYGINGTLDYTGAPFAYASTEYATNLRDNAAVSGNYELLLTTYKNWIFKNDYPFYTVNVIGGTIVGGGSSGRYQYVEDSVNVTATVPEGGTFIRWELTRNIGVEPSEESPTIFFNMPLGDITLTAIMDLPEAPAQHTSDSKFRPTPPTPSALEIPNPRGELDYIEAFSTRHGTAYVMRDLSVTPFIRKSTNTVDDQTAMLAIRSAVRRARFFGTDEIVINLPEGTLMSETLTAYIARYSARYGVGINLNFAEEDLIIN